MGSRATTDASPEARWSIERLRVGKGLISGQGRGSINISFACTVWGGGVLCQCRRTLAEEKNYVSANYEELKQTEDKQTRLSLHHC